MNVVHFPTTEGGSNIIPTSKAMPSVSGTIAHQRAPTDPYYYADVEIQNIVIGSRWMLGYDDDGTYTELDSGTAASTAVTVDSVPSYGSPFLLELRVRKSSGGTKYEPLNQSGYHSSGGITMYISQAEDEVAV